MTITINDGGFGDFLRSLQNTEPLQTGLRDAAEYVLAEEQQYPAQFSHPMIPALTPAQRRYLFWAKAQGLINIPYQRTGDVGAAWEVSMSGLTATVGNTSQIAPLVKGRRMTTYHAITGWEAVDVTAIRVQDTAVDIFKSHGVAQWLKVG